MGSAYLKSFISNSRARAEAGMTDVLANPNFKNSYQHCYYQRQHGACSFLHAFDTQTLFDCLHRSAGCYLFALKNIPDAEKRVSEFEPIFDAIAAGFDVAVVEMLPYIPLSFNKSYEYEEEFIYISFILNYFFEENSKKEKRTIELLDRYELILEGSFSARFDLCQSFFKKSDEEFYEAFDQLLVEREERIVETIKREVMGEDEWAWRKYISFEGLGLLMLASKLGFETEKNYSQIPEILRRRQPASFDSEYWKGSVGIPYWMK